MAKFIDSEILAERVRNNPPLAIARLEELLTDNQAAAFDAALAPAVGPQERLAAIVDARRVLTRAGLAPGDSVFEALNSVLNGTVASTDSQ